MKKIIVILFVCVSLLFVGCGKDDRQEISIYNWGDYLDPELISQFEKENNCRVKYDTFTSNEDMYVKVKNSTDTYDILVPSDYMIQRLISEDALQSIDKAQLPNLSNIDPTALNLPFDPDNKYSIPYFWGVLGILYNPEIVTDSTDTWNILWNEKYASKILMYDSVRDSMGASLKRLGFSMNATSETEINAARDALIAQKPLVMAYVTDNVKNLMATEGAGMALVYSGDAAIIIDENSKLNFSIPKEGSNVYYDNFVIPKNAKNPALATTFINFMLEPENAAKNMEYVGFSAPNPNAIALMGEAWQKNPGFNIKNEDVLRCEIFEDLPNNILELYNKAWTEINVSK
ncbi:MAG: ABC transporter substrate-binding protein [Eubacteriaceae bacterium]